MAAVAAAAAFLTSGGSAWAADPVTASVTEISSTDGKVTGTLTLRSRTAVRVDPASMTATIDGSPATVTVRQGASPERRTMLVIDTSGSMDDEGMATVRAATRSFLKTVPADVKIGVVSFANTAGVDLAPTTDRAAVQRVVDGLASRGNTALYSGVQSAIRALGTSGDRSMVLLSDGADTVATDPSRSLRTVTAALKAGAVRVDVVRFRSTDPDAARALDGFANANGGSVTSAENTKGVVAAFDASAKALDSQVRFEISPSEPLSGNHTVVLGGRASGLAFAVTSQVNAQATAATTAPTPTATPLAKNAGTATAAFSPHLTWFPYVAAGLLGVGLFGMAAGAFIPTLQSRREQRVDSIERYVVGPRTTSRSENKPVHTPLTEQLTAFGERAMQGRRYSSWVASKIETADLPFRLGDWFILCLASAVVGAGLGFVLFQKVPTLGIGFGFVAGVVLPQLALRFLAQRRAKKFEAVLPDVLMLVSTSLRSGFGLPQALDAVARDAAEPAAKEFSRALAETRIGTDIADALDHAAGRMESKSLRWTIMAIRIQRDVGGNLAETLTTTAATLRERESLFRQVRALSAEGRLSAYLLTAIPIFLFFYLVAVNYEYISLLWTRPMGLLMIGAAIVLVTVGVIWMRRLVRVEV